LAEEEEINLAAKNKARKPTEKEFAEMRKEAEAWQLASIDAWLKHEKD
jgi:hypothetical protein